MKEESKHILSKDCWCNPKVVEVGGLTMIDKIKEILTKVSHLERNAEAKGYPAISMTKIVENTINEYVLEILALLPQVDGEGILTDEEIRKLWVNGNYDYLMSYIKDFFGELAKAQHLADEIRHEEECQFCCQDNEESHQKEMAEIMSLAISEIRNNWRAYDIKGLEMLEALEKKVLGEEKA